MENGTKYLVFILENGTKNVTEINNYLCYDNQTMETVDLRNFEGTNIPYCAFQGDSNLSTVKLSKVAEIEGYAFSSCSSLTQLANKYTLSNMGNRALCSIFFFRPKVIIVENYLCCFL